MTKFLFVQKIKSVFPCKRFVKDNSALAMMEFALLLPLLLTLGLGGFEVARFALLMQKLDRITATFSDLIAREESLSVAELDNLFDATNFLAAPFDFNANGMIVVTSVEGRDGQAPLVIGQRSQGNITGGVSQVGIDGGSATLPAVFTSAGGQTLEEDEGLIITEIFFDYQPYIAGEGSFLGMNLFSGSLIYQDSFFRPRLSDRITFD
ncbi:MAG: pilus assembly protein [Sneathiella sp.]|nr:pilus assembly protein [Sneathiella sp.]